MDKNIRN